MIKIAIDTNIWFNLIENLEIDLLDNLWDKINENKAQIILPECVEMEFNKKLTSIKKNTLKNHQEAIIQDIDSIVQSIYSLFEKSIKLKTIDKGLSDWVMSGKAPNHNGVDNYQDTLVLNTLLSLPRSSSFYFVANDKDFRISKQDYSLHPDIIEKFKENDLTISYSVDLAKLLFQISKRNFVNEGLNNYELYNWKAFKLKVKNKTLFQQLKEAIGYYYKELDFIPLSFLTNIYPLKSNSNEVIHFKGTTLVTKNKLLFNFFDKSLKQYKRKNPLIKESYFKSTDEIEAYSQILKTLNSNLIYAIQYESKQISILLEKEQEKECKCNICTLNRNDVRVLAKQLEEDIDDNPKKLLNTAYYYFKIKDYYNSYLLIKKILDSINPKAYPIIYSIAQENISILNKVWISGDKRFDDVRSKIKPYNENSVLSKGISSIIGYIKYSKFFDYKFFNLIEDYEKVKRRFDVNSGLGKSQNPNIEQENVIRWAELLNMSHNNGLFFEYYINTNRFALLTLKLNLYASIDRQIQSYISDYILKTTMSFISLKNYRDTFNELEIKTLRIQKKYVNEIFKLYITKIENFKKTVKNKLNANYRGYHADEIEKIAFLSAYINFSLKQSKQIITEIFLAFETDKKAFERKTKTLFDALIELKPKAFDTSNSEKFVNLIFPKKIDYNFKINSLFIILETHKKVKLNNAQFLKLLDKKIQEKTGYYRSYILHRLFELSNKKEKETILNDVYRSFENGDNFDFKTYTIFTSENIIPISEESLTKFISKVRLDFGKTTKSYQYDRYIENKSKEIESLDYLINHLYLFYDKPVSYLMEFKGKSDYYDFLINPENFDTSNFDVHWFYLAYRKSYCAIWKILNVDNKIKKHVSSEILKLNNEKYHKAFIRLLGLSDLQIE